MRVTKSSGITQEYQSEKIKNVIDWATQGTSINSESILVELDNYLFDSISTQQIQDKLVKIAADKISAQEPDYQYIAARLRMFGLRKQVYGCFQPTNFLQHIKRCAGLGVYDKEILQKYTESEIEQLGQYVDHERDMDLSYAGAMQLIEKYLVKDRSTGQIFETPQYAYMLIAMCLHQEEPFDVRLNRVKRFYDVASTKKGSLPTPIMAGVRTPTRQFSSCVLIDSGDDLESINETSSAIVNYISKRAGIGVNGGRIRAEGSRIRSGEVRHTGVIPFWKYFQSAVKSCSQGGVRGGAATVFYPIWHLEVEKLLVLKNNRGVEENRIRQMDYGVQFNTLMYERLANNDYITLFSPDVVSGEMYEAYFSDPEKFREMYEALEANPDVRKKRVKAIDLFSSFMLERSSTARIYVQNVDNINENSPFKDTIYMSNLCLEIALPTSPITKDGGEIALCTLAAFNLGELEYDEIEEVAEVLVRALDNLLDYQDYPVKQAERAKMRRSLGIGVINYAYFLAKNYTRYSDQDSYELTHKWFEKIQYSLLKAGNNIAKEKGACGDFDRTTYADGILPIDRYKKTVDEYVEPVYYCDWKTLRKDIKEYGLRNSTYTALMPSESSSQVHNATNGIEPPRGRVSVKGSKDGVFNQVVPEVELLGDEYEYAWEMARNGNEGYLVNCAIMQKFTDQTISANNYYDPSKYENNKVPMSELLQDMLFFNYLGGKTLYYLNTRDGADGSEEVEETEIVKESDCAGCKV